jgi:uncharacterized protein YndB with AHSA1/START domain
MPDLSLTCKHTINAAPDVVFNAWLNPEIMAQFMSPRPDMTVTEARSDATVGGSFHVLMIGDKEYPHEGVYKEITPHSRLVFTWMAPWSHPDSTVELDFAAAANGTEVTLTHTHFTSEDARDGHAQGWAGILGKLAVTLEG